MANTLLALGSQCFPGGLERQFRVMPTWPGPGTSCPRIFLQGPGVALPAVAPWRTAPFWGEGTGLFPRRLVFLPRVGAAASAPCDCQQDLTSLGLRCPS